MATWVIHSTTLGTSAARPVINIFEATDSDASGLPLDPNTALREVNPASSAVALADFTDANEYTYTINDAGTGPVTLALVTSAKYSLTERQHLITSKVDALLSRYQRNTQNYRRFTETRGQAWVTYMRDLLAVLGQPAFSTNPETVTFPTVPSETEDDTVSIFDRTYRRETVVGIVSQSGGVPTGELFETATNANGLYYRTADGFQVCRARIVPSYFNGTRMATTWTFPAAFHSLSSLSFVATFSTHNNSNTVDGLADTVIRQCEVMSRSRSTTSIDIHVLSPTYTFVTGDTVWLDITAIGRWFL